MPALTLREFRNGLSAALNRVDRGEAVTFRRRDRAYKVLPDDHADFVITSELQKKIDEAREDYRQGRCVVCNTIEELHAHLESL